MRTKIISFHYQGKAEQKPYGPTEQCRLDALNMFNMHAERSLTKLDELLLDTVTNRSKTPTREVYTAVQEFNTLLTTLKENDLFGRYGPGYVMTFRQKLYELQEKYRTWFTVMSFDRDIGTLCTFCKELGVQDIKKNKRRIKTTTAESGPEIVATVSEQEKTDGTQLPAEGPTFRNILARFKRRP